MCDKALDIKGLNKNITGLIRLQEKDIDYSFNNIHSLWADKKISDKEFKDWYKWLINKIFDKFTQNLANFY